MKKESIKYLNAKSKRKSKKRARAQAQELCQHWKATGGYVTDNAKYCMTPDEFLLAESKGRISKPEHEMLDKAKPLPEKVYTTGKQKKSSGSKAPSKDITCALAS